MADTTPTPSPSPLPRAAKPSIVPGGGASRQETIRLAIRLGSVVLLTASVLIYACLRSKDLSVAEILAIVGGGAALAGLAGAAHRGGGGGATVVGGAMMLVLTVLGSGCGAGAIVPDPRPNDGVEPCSVERALVEGLDDAVGAVDEVLPDDAPKAAEGLSYARGGVEEGLAAVAACEALSAEGRSGLSAVLPWLQVAGHVVRGLLAILGAAGVDIPDALEGVLHSLGLAQAAPPPIEYEPPYLDAKAGP